MRAVNLIPAEQREGSASLTGDSGGAALILLGLVAGLVILAFVYGLARHSESKAKTELASASNELTELHAQIGQLAPYTSFIAMANQRVQTTGQLVASRFDWSHAFNELGRVLPTDAALTSLHGQVGSGTGSGSSAASSPSAAGSSGATPTSATPPGSTPTFAIAGCATSQSEVAQTLQRLRLMDGVSDVELQSSAKSGGGGGSGSSGSSGAGSGTCPPSAASFSATVTFSALPTPPATNSPAASATTVSNASGASK